MKNSRSWRALTNTSALVGAIAISLPAAGAAASDAVGRDRIYSIPSEPLSDALRDYGQASGRQLIFTEDLVRGRTAPALVGTYSPDAALLQLVGGSGLRTQLSPSGAVMILKLANPGVREVSGA
jgi:hypothetical protein